MAATAWEMIKASIQRSALPSNAAGVMRRADKPDRPQRHPQSQPHESARAG